LTDETFALHAVRFPSGVPRKGGVFTVNATAQVSWLLGTALGVALGKMVADIEPFGLDYVLPAIFIALIVLQIEETVDMGMALLTGALSVALLMLGAGQWNVIVATVMGATLGTMLRLWTNNRSS